MHIARMISDMGAVLLVYFSLFLTMTVKRTNAALLSLRNQWQNMPPSWGKSDDPCGGRWEGVICNDSTVVALSLWSMGLKGPVTGDIGDLSELISLCVFSG